MNEYIKSDLYRYYGKCDVKTLIKGYLINPTIRYQIAFRLSNSQGITKYIGYFLWCISRTKKSVHISINAKVGYGLFISHGGPIIVNPNTVIGNNCNLSQFTTIGSNKNQAAIIGDNTYIGPNVCIVESVHIGNNVTIGAGSVVTKDIPDNATAAGNYAKVLSYKNPGQYVGRRWKVN